MPVKHEKIAIFVIYTPYSVCVKRTLLYHNNNDAFLCNWLDLRHTKEQIIYLKDYNGVKSVSLWTKASKDQGCPM